MRGLAWRTWVWSGRLSDLQEREVRRMCVMSDGEARLRTESRHIFIEGLAGPRLRGILSYLDRALGTGHR